MLYTPVNCTVFRPRVEFRKCSQAQEQGAPARWDAERTLQQKSGKERKVKIEIFFRRFLMVDDERRERKRVRERVRERGEAKWEGNASHFDFLGMACSCHVNLCESEGMRARERQRQGKD